MLFLFGGTLSRNYTKGSALDNRPASCGCAPAIERQRIANKARMTHNYLAIYLAKSDCHVHQRANSGARKN
jgi:hypothetical protein